MLIIFFIIFSFPPCDFIIYIFINVSVGEKPTDIDNEEEVKQTSEYIKEFI